MVIGGEKEPALLHIASPGVIQRTVGIQTYLKGHSPTGLMVWGWLLAGASPKGFQQEHLHVAV